MLVTAAVAATPATASPQRVAVRAAVPVPAVQEYRKSGSCASACPCKDSGVTAVIRPTRPEEGSVLREIECLAGERFREVGLPEVADDEPASVETHGPPCQRRPVVGGRRPPGSPDRLRARRCGRRLRPRRAGERAAEPSGRRRRPGASSARPRLGCGLRFVGHHADDVQGRSVERAALSPSRLPDPPRRRAWSTATRSSRQGDGPRSRRCEADLHAIGAHRLKTSFCLPGVKRRTGAATTALASRSARQNHLGLRGSTHHRP
jgi:hypothetical protein